MRLSATRSRSNASSGTSCWPERRSSDLRSTPHLDRPPSAALDKRRVDAVVYGHQLRNDSGRGGCDRARLPDEPVSLGARSLARRCLPLDARRRDVAAFLTAIYGWLVRFTRRHPARRERRTMGSAVSNGQHLRTARRDGRAPAERIADRRSDGAREPAQLRSALCRDIARLRAGNATHRAPHDRCGKTRRSPKARSPHTRW
jgi:hypothetical protein